MLGTALHSWERAVTPRSSQAVQKMTRSIVSHSSSFACKRRGHPITLLLICHIHTMHFYPKFLSMSVNILCSCQHGSANLLIAWRAPCVRRPVFLPWCRSCFRISTRERGVGVLTDPFCPLTESKEGSSKAYLTPPHSYQQACVDMSWMLLKRM